MNSYRKKIEGFKREELYVELNGYPQWKYDSKERMVKIWEAMKEEEIKVIPLTERVSLS